MSDGVRVPKDHAEAPKVKSIRGECSLPFGFKSQLHKEKIGGVAVWLDSYSSKERLGVLGDRKLRMDQQSALVPKKAILDCLKREIVLRNKEVTFLLFSARMPNLDHIQHTVYNSGHHILGRTLKSWSVFRVGNWDSDDPSDRATGRWAEGTRGI